jgi:hypothetical protein
MKIFTYRKVLGVINENGLVTWGYITFPWHHAQGGLRIAILRARAL